MLEGSKCKDTKNLCDYTQASEPLDTKKNGTYLKMKEGYDYPPNYFCIRKVETANLYKIEDGKPLEQFAMIFSSN